MDLITILVTLKRSYNCVIALFIIHNSIHTSHLNTHVFHYPSHVQFITYAQFESSFHNLNITIYTKDFITTWGLLQFSDCKCFKDFFITHVYFSFSILDFFCRYTDANFTTGQGILMVPTFESWCLCSSVIF